MSGNAQKTPLQRSFNAVAERRALDTVRALGRALPCSVSAIPVAGVPIVTVKFEVVTPLTLPKVTVPIFGFEYTRYPVQVGCKGVVFPADAYLGGVSGLGGGTADLSTPANLSALMFFPVGNKAWDPSEDPNAVVTYGPNGVVLRDTAKSSTFTLTPDGITVHLLTALKEFFLSQGKLHVADDALVDGNATITGNFASGPATVNGALHATGNVSVDGSFEVGGTAAIKRMLTGTITTNFGGTISGAGIAVVTLSVTGAKIGDAVIISAASGVANGNGTLSLQGKVLANDVVTITAGNANTGPITPISLTYDVVVLGFS